VRAIGVVPMYHRTVSLVLLFGACALGCSEATPSIDVAATDAPVLAETAGIEEPEITDKSPFQVFGLASTLDAAATTITPVWLVNGTRETLIVWAAAGAETVVVDTVKRLDSVLVRLETPADSVALSARTTDGRNVGRVALSMDGEAKRAAFPR